MNGRLRARCLSAPLVEAGPVEVEITRRLGLALNGSAAAVNADLAEGSAAVNAECRVAFSVLLNGTLSQGPRRESAYQVPHDPDRLKNRLGGRSPKVLKSCCAEATVTSTGFAGRSGQRPH